MCDLTKLQCVESPGGDIKQVCDAKCSNSTPPELQFHTFRGVQIQLNFSQGEVDFNFTASTAMYRDVTGALMHATVDMANNLRFTWQDGQLAGKIQLGLLQTVNNGPETTAYALALGAVDGPAPASLADAMFTKDNTVFVLSRCNDWKAASCNFSSVFAGAAPSPAREALPDFGALLNAQAGLRLARGKQASFFLFLSLFYLVFCLAGVFLSLSPA